MKFKTNARCQGCVAAIRKSLNPILDSELVTFDLTSPDRVMTVAADVDPVLVEEAVTKAGFKVELL